MCWTQHLKKKLQIWARWVDSTLTDQSDSFIQSVNSSTQPSANQRLTTAPQHRPSVSSVCWGNPRLETTTAGKSYFTCVFQTASIQFSAGAKCLSCINLRRSSSAWTVTLTPRGTPWIHNTSTSLLTEPTITHSVTITHHTAALQSTINAFKHFYNALCIKTSSISQLLLLD